MNITDEGALLVKVNRHKHNYNGDICEKPSTYECGANQWFRQNNCLKGLGDCNDIKLFHRTEPFFIKSITEEEVRSKFDVQVSLLDKGYNPVIFFYTTSRLKSGRTFPIVGAYVVKEIVYHPNSYKEDIYIYPEKIIKIPLDTLQNEYLYQNSTDVTVWCRTVYRTAVFPFMQIISNKLQEEVKEDDNFNLETMADVIKHISDTPKEERSVFSEEKPAVDRESEKEVRRISDENAPESGYIIGDLRDRFNQEVDSIVNTAAKAGFYYSRSQVASLHNSLQTNPFLILSGISGGGKTSFALFYAQALGANIRVVSVRPDWTSPSHLLGFYDPFTKNFVPSETTRFINEAYTEYETNGNEAPMFILLLDEMNLARVEYYFSDFLSKMTLQDFDLRSIVLYEESEGDYTRTLKIPPNLKIIGTVNIDETTFLFSPKVLDRATYVFLNKIDIEGMGKVLEYRSHDFHHLKALEEMILPELKNLNAKLTEMGNPFGYRTVWEIIRWIDAALTVGIIKDPYEGLDVQVESRVLTKIDGTNNDSIFNSLKNYFQDRIYPDSEGKLVFERSLTRLTMFIERARREEYVIGQQ